MTHNPSGDVDGAINTGSLAWVGPQIKIAEISSLLGSTDVSVGRILALSRPFRLGRANATRRSLTCPLLNGAQYASKFHGRPSGSLMAAEITS